MRIDATPRKPVRNVARMALDLFRRRRVEKKALAGQRKKGHVLIGPVERGHNEVHPTYSAVYVPPLLGSAKRPFLDHEAGTALQEAAYQTAFAGMKKFEKNPNCLVRLGRVSFKFVREVGPRTRLRVETTLKERSVTGTGNDRRVFDVRFVDAAHPKTSFGTGQFVAYLIPPKGNE